MQKAQDAKMQAIRKFADDIRYHAEELDDMLRKYRDQKKEIEENKNSG